MESAPCAETAAERKERSKGKTTRSITGLLKALASESGFSDEKKKTAQERNPG
jgi:hypothetical protein